MRFPEVHVLGIHDAEGDGNAETDDTDEGGKELKHPMKFDGAEPAEGDHAEREEEQEGSAEADGMDYYQGWDGAGEGLDVDV